LASSVKNYLRIKRIWRK